MPLLRKAVMVAFVLVALVAFVAGVAGLLAGDFIMSIFIIGMGVVALAIALMMQRGS